MEKEKEIIYVKIKIASDGSFPPGDARYLAGGIFKAIKRPGREDEYKVLLERGYVYASIDHAEPVHIQELPFAIGQEIEVRDRDDQEWGRYPFNGLNNYPDTYGYPYIAGGYEWKQARAIEEKEDQSDLLEKIEQLQAQIDQLRKEATDE